jgi:hypothetical protein
MIMSRQYHLVLGLAGCLWMTTGCRPTSGGSDGSKTKSLDNFARGDDAELVVNQCGINYTGSEGLPAHVTAVLTKIVSTDEPSRRAVIGALVAVPEKLMKPFFDVGGEIHVSTGDAPAECQNLPFSADERELAGTGSVPSCWQQPDATSPPRIHLSPDPRMIRFSLLRSFAYIYTEFFARRVELATTPPYDKPEWRAAATAFREVRTSLAGAFMRDLQKAQHAGYPRLAKFQAGSPEQFVNYVFAEAVDSFYCSAQARTAFETQFKEAYGVFTDKGEMNSPLRQFGAG